MQCKKKEERFHFELPLHINIVTLKQYKCFKILMTFYISFYIEFEIFVNILHSNTKNISYIINLNCFDIFLQNKLKNKKITSNKLTKMTQCLSHQASTSSDEHRAIILADDSFSSSTQPEDSIEFISEVTGSNPGVFYLLDLVLFNVCFNYLLT